MSAVEIKEEGQMGGNAPGVSWERIFQHITSQPPSTRNVPIRPEDVPEFPGGQPQPRTSGTNKFLEYHFERLSEATAEIKTSPPLGQTQSSGPPRIPDAPSIFENRGSLRKYFDPEVYSFGPIHNRHDPRFRKREEIKLKLAATYIHTQRLDGPQLFNKIIEKIEYFMQWYDESCTRRYNDEELSWIFFVDGCALLYYIIDVVEYSLLGKSRPVNFWPQQYCHSDVFRLVNQLPYELLSLLTRKQEINPRDSFLPPNPEHCINMFIAVYSFEQFGSKVLAVESVRRIGNRKHLLDVLWRYLGRLQPPHHEATTRSIPLDAHLRYGIRELKRAGIRLKPSESGQLTKVSFQGWFLKSLALPPVHLSPTMASQLANLMAYETCSYHFNHLPITSYVCFLNSLVHDAQDVAEMKSAEILHNFLSSDEEAIELLNELASIGSPNPGIDRRVKLAITHYFMSPRWKIMVLSWIAEAVEVYFRTPWTTIAFIAAAFALVATIINTVFTILRHRKQCTDPPRRWPRRWP